MQPNAGCILGRVGVFATRIRAHFRAFTAHLRRTFCAFCTLSTDFADFEQIVKVEPLAGLLRDELLQLPRSLGRPRKMRPHLFDNGVHLLGIVGLCVRLENVDRMRWVPVRQNRRIAESIKGHCR